MPASPRRPTSERLRKLATEFVVFVGDSQGNAPTPEDERPEFQVLSISQSAGGERIDGFVLRYDLAKGRTRLQDTGAPLEYHRQFELRLRDEDGNPTVLVAWGMYRADEQTIDESTESLTIHASCDKYLFGGPVKTLPVWDATANLSDPEAPLPMAIPLHLPLVFNPRIDDVILGNKSDKRQRVYRDDDGRPQFLEFFQDEDDDDPDDERPFYFSDPESVRTEVSRDFQDDRLATDELRKWTIPEAVHRLCWLLNPAQTYIRNPRLADLEPVFLDHDEDLKNILIPEGMFLPEALDTLLKPLGFTWKLRHELVPDEEAEDDGDDEAPPIRETTLEFFKRGTGDSVELTMQRVGETLDLTETNVVKFSKAIALFDLFNKITVRGSRRRVEGTFRLYPTWKADDDSIDLAELEVGQPKYYTKSEVFRKFVLNEAKDYENDRTFLSAAQQIDFDDTHLQKFFADTVPSDFNQPWFARRRRKLHPCVSQRVNDEGLRESNRYIVEFWDRNVEDAEDPDELHDPGWTKVTDGFDVLEKEAGIIFHKVPGSLWILFQELCTGDPPDDVDHPGLFLRITASVDADVRIEVTHDYGDSPNGETIELILDLDDKFHYRRISDTSQFVGDGGDEIDDEEKMEEYAERVFKTQNAATLNCQFTLPGCDHSDLAIGKMIEKINGREINLQANARTAEEPRHLQILGWNINLDGTQQTQLIVEVYREERPVV